MGYSMYQPTRNVSTTGKEERTGSIGSWQRYIYSCARSRPESPGFIAPRQEIERRLALVQRGSVGRKVGTEDIKLPRSKYGGGKLSKHP